MIAGVAPMRTGNPEVHPLKVVICFLLFVGVGSLNMAAMDLPPVTGSVARVGFVRAQLPLS
jgi:hypothetical protein